MSDHQDVCWFADAKMGRKRMNAFVVVHSSIHTNLYYMGRGHLPESLTVDACDLLQYFDDKVSNVRAATTGAPTFSSAPTGCSLSDFSTLSVTDVTAAIHRLPDKQCANDPLPTRFLKDNICRLVGTIYHCIV